jgi:hypothetical protein
MAEIQKEQIVFPILGQKAPDFEALTTQGTLRLSDYNIQPTNQGAHKMA